MPNNEIAPTPDPLSPTGVYIPSDIQDCFRELDKMLAVSVRDEIRKNDEDDLSRYHFGLGMWIRNNWGLWIEESRLKQYFDSLGGDSRRWCFQLNNYILLELFEWAPDWIAEKDRLFQNWAGCY